MTETDKIVAAILTAVLCGSRRDSDETEYLDTYDEFLDEMKLREKAKRRPLVIRAQVKRKSR